MVWAYIQKQGSTLVKSLLAAGVVWIITKSEMPDKIQSWFLRSDNLPILATPPDTERRYGSFPTGAYRAYDSAQVSYRSD